MRLMSMVAGAAEGSSTMQTLTEAMKGSFETMVSDSMSMDSNACTYCFTISWCWSCCGLWN